MQTKQLTYLFVILLLTFGCKSKQHLAVQQKSERKPVEMLIEKIKEAEPQFTTANVSKMNINLDLNGRTMSVAASCKLLNDSAMHISIMPALGIELFKVEIYRDSLHVFDKFNRRSYSTDYNYMNEKLGIVLSYQSIQELISNRFFVSGQQNPDFEFMTAKTEGNESVISLMNETLQQITRSNDLNRITSQNIVAKKKNYIMNATYETFEPAGDVVFPRKININVSGNRRAFNCDFSIQKVTFNEKVQLQPIDRSRFVKSNIDQLLTK